jgi:hypothetical protein
MPHIWDKYKDLEAHKKIGQEGEEAKGIIRASISRINLVAVLPNKI